MTERHPGPGPWTFLTNHAHVLLCLAAEPGILVRVVADRVGISERAVLRILHDLAEAGYVERERVGRRTHYRVRLDRPMRHAVEADQPVGRLVDALGAAWTARPGPGKVKGTISTVSPNPQGETAE
jgi:DNA-binding transcriptional ArsR family regulator